MAEKQISDMSTSAAPLDRVTKNSERFVLLAVNAHFDGSAAGFQFLPCVEIISDSGQVVARCRGSETIPLGDEADVTFAPFLGKSATGIRFSTDNKGDFLSVEATSSGGLFARGIALISDTTATLYAAAQNLIQSATQIRLVAASDASSINIGHGVQIYCGDGSLNIQIVATKTVTVGDHTNAPIFRINEDGSLQGKTGKALSFNL